MGHWLKRILGLSDSGEAPRPADVDRIRQLKETAQTCRLEYAAARQREEEGGETPLPDSLDTPKRRVTEAEAAYAVALQHWDNKQWRISGR